MTTVANIVFLERPMSGQAQEPTIHIISPTQEQTLLLNHIDQIGEYDKASSVCPVAVWLLGSMPVW